MSGKVRNFRRLILKAAKSSLCIILVLNAGVITSVGVTMDF